MTSTTTSDTRPWRHLYNTARWQALREAQLNEQPLCEVCLVSDIVEPATVVHHKIAHKGDLDLFWGSPLQSVCKPCHDKFGQLEDHGKRTILFGPDGWPI